VRVQGLVAGAFDREHATLEIDAAAGAEVQLEVEPRRLPTNALPAGPGFRWWWLNLRAGERARGWIEQEDAQRESAAPANPHPWPVVAHAHLDVAWLWTYEEARRKAMRTFAIAANLLERDPDFIFAQSQPQLYAFVERTDAAFFERISAFARERRFDASIAALWVEPDCNVPSGESLLRQMMHAQRYCLTHFGITPSVAWLPDSFGFANTLPTLLAHAGIPYFATTKLQWNDTTRFPYPQFRWRGPDGSQVVGALIASYGGDVSPERIASARERNEPLVAGYGDGGGGVTASMIADAREACRWSRPADWFAQVAEREDQLPVCADELYLEYHRGVYTTHHDVKARNAALERRLGALEESLAWCVAIKAPPGHVRSLQPFVNDAWEIVLRNQFHDVLPGTSIARVYEDVHEEYDAADALLDRVEAAVSAILPRSATSVAPPEPVVPVYESGAWRFDNGIIAARVGGDGSISDLRIRGGPNVIERGNVLAIYDDRPARWDAWNIDAGYERTRRTPPAGAARLTGGVLNVPFAFAGSHVQMHIRLLPGEPFLRVDLHVDWRARHTLLRVENDVPVCAAAVCFGTPHGTIERSTATDTPQLRAKFEVCGQRFAAVRAGAAAGVIFALDTYGWSANATASGGVRLGHSLLRGTTWPDPGADYGHHEIRYAFGAFEGPAIGRIEQAWRRFSHQSGVPLFRSDSDGVAVVACKAAEDGDGVIVRIRECDGAPATARLRSGGRLREVRCVDALEREIPGEVSLEREELVATLGAFALRSFRVRF